MNKKELIGLVSEKTGATKKATTETVDALIEVVIEALQNGEEVNISGFGKFTVAERAARTGRNPQTGDTIEIEATKAPKFKPSKAFKDVFKA